MTSGSLALAGVRFDAVSRQRLEAEVKAADLALARAIAPESDASSAGPSTR